MGFSLDSYLGVHTAAVELRQRKAALIATNLANSDTPGYKARDLGFKDTLNQIQGQTNAPALMQVATRSPVFRLKRSIVSRPSRHSTVTQCKLMLSKAFSPVTPSITRRAFNY